MEENSNQLNIIDFSNSNRYFPS